MTYAQAKRQSERQRNGQYRKMAACELCGKSVGSNYCSDPRQSGALGEHGLILHERCAKKLAAMSDQEALAQFIS